MSQYSELKAAIVETLVGLNVTPEKPVSLSKLSPRLIRIGYSEDEVIYALFAMEREGMIDLLNGNRVTLSKKL